VLPGTKGKGMIRNLKALGLALAAALALGAVVASTASAKFDSEIEHTLISGEQPAGAPHTLKVEAGVVTCKTAKFSGTSVGANTGTSWTSDDLTITPEYGGCTAVVLGVEHATDVRTNGCTYTFTAGETFEGETKVHGTTDIVCPAGKVIEWEITTPNVCNITIAAQPDVEGVTYHNTGAAAKRDVDWILAIMKLAYTQDGAFCPGNNLQLSKKFLAGKYTGEVTSIGKNTEGTQVGIWVT